MSHAFELLFTRETVGFVVFSSEVFTSILLSLSKHFFILFLLGLSIELSFFIRRVEGLVEILGLHSLLVESLLILERCCDHTLNELGFHFSHVSLATGNCIKELKVFITGRIFIGTVPESASFRFFILVTPLKSSQLSFDSLSRFLLVADSDSILGVFANRDTIFFFNASYEKACFDLVFNKPPLLLSGQGPDTGF